jgi:hypothetical protein
MAAIREVVLDAETGLPEVRVSRSEDGQLTYRVHQIHPGGMSVYVPISDAVLQQMREHFDGGDDKWQEKLQAVATSYAVSLRSADAQREMVASELQARLDAMGATMDVERAEHAETLAELQALRTQPVPETTTTKRTAARGRATT